MKKLFMILFLLICAATCRSQMTDFDGNPRDDKPDIGAYEYQFPVVMYYNVQMSATASKDNCGAGYTTQPVIYTVPASKWYSKVSQVMADSGAIVDLATNKQFYANEHGTCIYSVTYFNTKVTTWATRNNCPSGYKGTRVYYYVLAKQYSSVISQADAQAKAQADATRNKQAYANLKGGCIRR
jgi:hypothetical protein